MNFLPLPVESSTRFVPLLLILVLAFAVPILLSRFRQVPVVVGEIIAGLIIGVSGFNLVSHEPVIDFLSDIGLAFLMFIAGMEIDFNILLPQKNNKGADDEKPVLLYASGIYLLSFLLAYPSSLLLARLGYTGDTLLLTLVLVATSLGVLLPILKSRGLLNVFSGQLVFVTAMLADFITVIVFTIYTLTFSRGFNVEILSIGFLFLAFLIFIRFGPRIFGTPRIRKLVDDLSEATVQIKVRGALTILMIFVVLAEFLNAELILGAFLAGMIISLLRTESDTDLIHQMEAFGFGFFIPIFFIMVGAELNLRTVLENPNVLLLLPVFLLLSMLIKVLPTFLAFGKLSVREVLANGLLLNTHLSLEVAIAVIGLRLGLLSPTDNTTIILFSLITVLTMPIFFNALAPTTVKRPSSVHLIFGWNETAMRTAQELQAHGDAVRFILPPQEHPETQSAFLIQSNLNDVSPTEVNSALVLYEDDTRNLTITRELRERGIQNIIALVNNPAENLTTFQKMGAQVYSPALQRSTMLTLMARNPNTLGLLTSPSDEFDVMETRLRNPQLFGKSVRDLKLPGGMLLLNIQRGNRQIVPRGNTLLEEGDVLTIFGRHTDLHELRGWLEGKASPPNWQDALI